LKSFDCPYKSFDELYDTMLRGNEIEFRYKDKLYFILPYYKGMEVIGVSFGKFNSEEVKVCFSKQELYEIKVDNMPLGEIITSVDILWNNF